jgi:hypothetical protein
MDTAFNDLYTLQEYRASGYNFDQGGLMNCRFEDTYKSTGCGGLISTAKDLYLWNRALDSDRLLPEGFRKLLFKRNLNSYGFGWMLRDVVRKDGHDTLSVAFHGGSDFGFAGFISKNLTNGTCIVVLSNLETAPVYKISEDISRMLLGEDVQPPLARQAIRSLHSKRTRKAESRDCFSKTGKAR